MKKKEKPVEHTKDVGWQFGLRKTLKIWLGELEDELEIEKSYKTKGGIEGLVRVFTPYSHSRMNWKKRNWKNISTVQVRVIGNQEKATISFHQEKLLDENQREEMKLYWNKKMTKIEDTLTPKRTTNRQYRL